MIPIGIINVGLTNLNGVLITKYMNSSARSLVFMAKTVLVWIIGIIITLTLGKINKLYYW